MPRQIPGATSPAPALRDWIEAELASGLPAFAGTAISGTLAVKPDLLNELIAKWLQAPAADAAPPPVDVNQVKRILKSVALRAEPGTVLVDFTIAV